MKEPAIVRWPDGGDATGQDAMMLFAPCLTRDGWVEIRSPMISEADLAKKLAAAGA